MLAMVRLPSSACDTLVAAGANPDSMQTTRNSTNDSSLINDKAVLADIARPKRKRARKVLTEEQQLQKKLKRKAQLQTAQQIYRKKKMEKTNELVNENAALKQVVKELHHLLKLRTNIDYLDDYKDSLDESRHLLIRNIISGHDYEASKLPSDIDTLNNSTDENYVKNMHKCQIKKEDLDIAATYQNSNDPVMVCSALDDFDLESMSSININNDSETKKLGFDLLFFENVDCISDISSNQSEKNSSDTISGIANGKLLSNESTFGILKLIDLNFINDSNFDGNLEKDLNIPLSFLASLDKNYSKYEKESPESMNTNSPYSTNSWEEGQALLSPQQSLQNLTLQQHILQQNAGSDSATKFLFQSNVTDQQAYDDSVESWRQRRQSYRYHLRHSTGSFISPDNSYRRRSLTLLSADSNIPLNVRDAYGNNDNETYSSRNGYDFVHHNMPILAAGHAGSRKGIKYIDFTNSNSSDIDSSATSNGSALLLENNKQATVRLKAYCDNFPQYIIHNYH